MNTLESIMITTPFGDTDECAKFTIYEVSDPFTLHNITKISRQYTFSCWVKSNAASKIAVGGQTIDTSTIWTRAVLTFVADSADMRILFHSASTFYIYNAQLEIGNKPSDWTEAPEDTDEEIQEVQTSANNANAAAEEAQEGVSRAEAAIQLLKDSIAMLVTDENGTSLMTQDPSNGNWTFSMAQTQKTLEDMSAALAGLNEALGSVDDTVEALRGSMDNAETSLEWVRVDTYQDEPCVIMAESDSDFKVIITNTRMIYYSDSLGELATFTNQALNVKKAVIEEELQQGPFVWKLRSNGNMGLLWKGAIS